MANEGVGYKAKLRSYRPPVQSVCKVLETTELLEAIMLHLPPIDLLESQRISKTFQAAVEGSIALKRALFMEPPAATSSDTTDNGFPIINPLLATCTRTGRSKTSFTIRGRTFVLQGHMLPCKYFGQPAVEMAVWHMEASKKSAREAGLMAPA